MANIYLDYNATTPIFPCVADFIKENLNQWGNPSSIHWAGREPKSFVREARSAVAQVLNVSPLEIIFTSGGSESNNMIIKGLFQTQFPQKKKIISTKIEHPSVINTLEYLERLGAEVYYVPISRKGEFNLSEYEKLLSPDVFLVSVMTANNETGSLFPIGKIAKMAHEAGAYFHTDAVQAFGKIPLDLKRWNVDFASFSAHKFYTLKGCGFAYLRKGIELPSLIHGGGQERHRRGGTENVLAIGALGQWCKQVLKNENFIETKVTEVENLRNDFEVQLLKEIPHIKINCSESSRLPNTSNFVVEGVNGETLLMALDLKGYAVSTGAACSSGSNEPSPVLRAMGFNLDEAQSSLRVSLGWMTTKEEMNLFLEDLKKTVEHLRRLT